MEDMSEDAAVWRNSSLVQWAMRHWAYETTGEYACAYRHRNRFMLANPFQKASAVSVADLARLFDVSLGPMGLPPLVEAAVGVDWFGVDTQMSVIDSQTLHSILWRLQIDLVIEIGTMCGGSAIFYAKTMAGYNPRAKVATFDVQSIDARVRMCTAFSRKRRLAPGETTLARPGLNHTFWASLTASGSIVPFLGRAHRHKTELDRLVSEASTVMVIDDGDHATHAVMSTWQALRNYTSVGSYYLVQDTRLDTDCAYAILTSSNHFCRNDWRDAYEKGTGGPGLAVDRIVRSDSFRQGNWRQDRSIEAWGVTQHPGGYLLRGKQ
jgi:cephalosporin hydroxylase